MVDDNLSELSAITLPSGTKYRLKDAWVRGQLSSIAAATAGIVVMCGRTTTQLSDQLTTGTVNVESAIEIRGTSLSAGQAYSAEKGDAFIYGNKEFIWDGSRWLELGDLTGLKTLAYKDSGSVTLGNAAVSVALPSSSISVKVEFTPSGSVTLSNSNVTAAVSAASSGAATYTPNGNLTAALSSNGITATGDYTPAGSVQLCTTQFTSYISTYTDGNYLGESFTPSGTVTAPTINLNAAGSTKTIKEISGDSVVSSVATYNAGATAPAGSVQYWSVANETLTLNGIYAPTIGTSSLTVKTGDASYTATAPTFNGTSVVMQIDGTTITGATFAGTAATISAAGIPSGTISGALTGTGVRLVTDKFSIPSAAGFSGNLCTLTASGTTSATTLNGNTTNLSGTYNVNFS